MRRSDAEQISRGKLSCFPCTVAGSTLRVLDGYGLRGKWPAGPTLAPCTRFLSIIPARLIYASFRHRLAAMTPFRIKLKSPGKQSVRF